MNRDIFIINFQELDIGEYNYTFKLDNNFFEKYENSEIKKAKLVANVKLVKHRHTLKLDFDMSGKINVQCDRCLDYFDTQVRHKAELYVEFAEENSDLSDADNKITLSADSIEIVLDKHLYDYAHLSVPYRNVHKNKNECNAEMLKNLEEVNTNKENKIDPRWDKLKTLMN